MGPLIVFWLTCGVIAAVIASAKNRNAFGRLAHGRKQLFVYHPGVRGLIILSCLALAIGACSSAPSAEKPGGATVSPSVTVVAPEKPSQPKTLEAATAAAQEDANRFSSGDFAGDWEMGSKQVHDGISKTDYVTLQETCKDTGLPIAVTGVRMEGTDTAIVRQEINIFGGIKHSQTMVYEDGLWLWAPSDEFAKELGKPIHQIIADEKADGNCSKGN
jgi:hypothetical protein